MSPHLPLAGPDDLAGPGSVPGSQGQTSFAPVDRPPAGAGSASRRLWDRLGETERRRQLDAMDPDHVRSLAATMPLIEQAKGILMGCYGCDPTAAFAVLDRVSSSRNLKLRDLAGLVVAAASTPVGMAGPDAPSPCEQVRRVLQEPPTSIEVSTPVRSGTGTRTDRTDRKGRA